MDIKSAVCLAKNGKYTKHTTHIVRRVHCVRNVKKYIMHDIVWCEGGLQLSDIATNKVVENYFGALQLIEITCTIGVVVYKIVCGSIVLYD